MHLRQTLHARAMCTKYVFSAWQVFGQANALWEFLNVQKRPRSYETPTLLARIFIGK